MTARASNTTARKVWIASGILSAFLVLLAVIALTSQPHLDTRLCDSKKPRAGVVAMLVDRTDSLTAGQRTRISNYVLRYCDSLPPNTLVAVFGIQDAAQGVLASGFCNCKPDDGSRTSPIIGSPQQVHDEFVARFQKPLRDDLERAWPHSASPNSPIMESLRELATNPDFMDRARPRTILIFSDMIQNTPALSMFSGVPDWRALKQEQLAGLLCDLSGCRVSAFELERPRDAKLQDNALENWWMAYFENCGVPSDKRAYHRLPAASL